MIALEVLVEIEKWLPFIAAVLVLAFDWGILYAKLKEKPTKEQVNDMIEKKLISHSELMSSRLQSLKSDFSAKIEDYDYDLSAREEDIKNLTNIMLEIKLNLKSICEQLNVKYLSINNGGN